MKMVLSILICTIEERREKLTALCLELNRQIIECGALCSVEVLAECDNREMPTGHKRNVLMERAAGEYVAYFDDDDQPERDYVESILRAIETRPDCVGIEGMIVFKGNTHAKFIHSIQCDGWYTGRHEFFRTPNHLNPVKRSLALQAKFPDDLWQAEDKAYSDKLRPLLKTEVYIDHPIYIYWSRTRL
jgi:glycosyltransferase involved in cell wall biosynthesis